MLTKFHFGDSQIYAAVKMRQKFTSFPIKNKLI